MAVRCGCIHSVLIFLVQLLALSPFSFLRMVGGLWAQVTLGERCDPVNKPAFSQLFIVLPGG